MNAILSELNRYSQTQLIQWVSRVFKQYQGKSLRFITKGVRGVSKLLTGLPKSFQRLRVVLSMLLDKLTYLLQGVVG